MSFIMPCPNYTVEIMAMTNGYLVNLIDSDQDVIASAVAETTNTRGYSTVSLMSAIETLLDLGKELGAAANKADYPRKQTAFGFPMSDVKISGDSNV